MNASSEELTSKLESFLKNLIMKINDSSLISNIQAEYNTLMDIFGKLTFMSKEELDSIDNDIASFEKEIENLNMQNRALITENELLQKKVEEITLKMNMQKEGLMQKIEILQNTLDESSHNDETRDNTIIQLEQMIHEIKSDYSTLMEKYKLTVDEMEIHKKNTKKIFQLEKAIQELTQENEKLSSQVKAFNQSEDFKIKFHAAQVELKENSEKFLLMIRSLDEVKKENSKLSQENFDKFEKINHLQSDIKLKAHKIEEIENDNKKLRKTLDDLDQKSKEAEYNIKNFKILYDNQLKELKKEIDRLMKSNESLKKENIDLTEQIKHYQHYTNFAKASKEVLNKKDFSILETMSRRVEEAESLNESYKKMIDNLGSENEELKTKIKSFENVVFLYMKDDIDLFRKSSDSRIPEEELQEIQNIKSSPESLAELCILLKKQNFQLQKQIEEITIECNQQMRMYKEKTEANLSSNFSLPDPEKKVAHNGFFSPTMSSHQVIPSTNTIDEEKATEANI